MPPVKLSRSSVLRKYVTEFGSDNFSEDGQVLFCLSCERSIASDKKFQVVQHLNTAKHKQNAARKSALRQKFVSTSFREQVDVPGGSRDSFGKELCSAFISANIPLWKVNNTKLKTFLEKHTNKRVPDESTLRKTCVTECFNEVITDIREALKNENIWISIDETTDAAGQCVCSAVVSAMKAGSKTYLLNIQILDRVNHSTIAKFFNDSLVFLWPDGIQYDSVLLFLTDAAPYIIKAANALKVLYPKLIHLTCLAHGLHRVAETVRSQYPEVDRLVSNVKKIFIKAPSRVSIFRELAPKLALPPQPILTRWGSWLEAVCYYAKHFTDVKKIVDSLDPEDAASIQIAQECFNSSDIENRLHYICSRFSILPQIIKELQSRNNSLLHSLSLVNQVSEALSLETHGVAKIACDKLNAVLGKNTGYKTICEISKHLAGETCEVQDQLTKEEIWSFSHVPVTSCDVERSFSLYKTFFTDKRRSFTAENLRMTFLVYCNSSIGQ